MKLNFTLILIFILFTFYQLNAQETIVTDRPDMTESAQTLDQFRFQLETGLLFETYEDQIISTNEMQLPTTLLRFGLTDFLELRFNFAHLRLSEPFNNTSVRGFGNYEAGMKLQLLDDEEVNVKIAFLSHLLLPIGNDALNTGNLGVVNKLALSHEFADVFGLSYNIGYDYLSSQIKQFTYSIALSFNYNSNLSFYIEPYGEYINSMSHRTNYNFGLAYLVNKDFQLDVSYGAAYGKLKTYKMNFISAGLSFRI